MVDFELMSTENDFFPRWFYSCPKVQKSRVRPRVDPKVRCKTPLSRVRVKHKKLNFTFQNTKSQMSIFNIAFEVDLSKVDFSMTILRGQRKSRFLQPVYFRFRRSRSKTFRWRDRADLRKGFQKSKVRGPSSLNPSNRQKFKLIFEGFL